VYQEFSYHNHTGKTLDRKALGLLTGLRFGLVRPGRTAVALKIEFRSLQYSTENGI